MTVLDFRAVGAPPRSELLRGLKKQEIDLILATGGARRYSSRSVMTRQGESARRLFLLWKGRARYFFETANGKRVNLIWITPGHTFGGTALASRPSNYLVSTEAVRDCTVLIWDSTSMYALAERYPQLKENIFLTALDYLSWYIAAHAALTSQTAGERLAHLILGYAPSIGQQVVGGIELDVTNEELANAANITPYTASRLISGWQKAVRFANTAARFYCARQKDSSFPLLEADRSFSGNDLGMERPSSHSWAVQGPFTFRVPTYQRHTGAPSSLDDCLRNNGQFCRYPAPG